MNKLIIPPMLIAYSLLTMAILYIVFPGLNQISYPINLLGVPLAIFGFTFMGRTRKLFRKHNTTLKISDSNYLITEGVFSKCRNPMYRGMTILLLGISMFSSNLAALGIPLLFIMLVSTCIIPKEEKLMDATFGESYREYKNRVRMWI